MHLEKKYSKIRKTSIKFGSDNLFKCFNKLQQCYCSVNQITRNFLLSMRPSLSLSKLTVIFKTYLVL